MGSARPVSDTVGTVLARGKINNVGGETGSYPLRE